MGQHTLRSHLAVLVPAFMLAALFVPHAQAQEASAVVGTWESTMETPRGSITQEFVFTLTDGVLSGTVTGPRGGAVELKDVDYSEGTLSFVVEREFRGNTRTQNITATLDGNTMTGEISGGPRGGRAFTATKKE